MIETFLIEHPFVAVATWVILYVSDYYLTLWGATLYQRDARAFIELGSYEMEPVFQTDVDSLRKLSPHFVWYLLLSTVLLLFLWWLSVRHVEYPALYLVGFGAYVLTEFVVHLRHARNIILFRSLGTPGAVEGHVKYARWVTEQAHLGELVAFAVFFGLCYLLSGAILFIGGVLGCLGILRRHARNARRPNQ